MSSTDEQIPQSYHPIYTKLDRAVESCHTNFQTIFNLKEHQLINQLQQKVKKIKVEIGELKKLTSNQIVEELILKKKQEKEYERMKLEGWWRELTEKLKKLEEEEKKLGNQNQESQFDVGNLNEKIVELRRENQKLGLKIQELRNNQGNRTFLTEAEKKNYVSPYKMAKRGHQVQHSEDLNETNKMTLNRKLSQLKSLRKIPNSILLQFLNRPQIKSQLYKLLQ